MALNDREKLNRIEEMKRKLFTKSYQTKMEHRDGFSHRPVLDVPSSWGVKEKAVDIKNKLFSQKTSMFKKFFIFSLIFFMMSIGYAIFTFLAGGNTVSNENIDISVLSNAFTAGGEELSLIVEIKNKNNASLDLSDLVVEYPKSSDGAVNTERIRESLGTIPAGAIKSENIKVTLFGEQGSTRTIKFSLEYRVGGSNAIFVKEKTYDVSISSTPVNISVDSPLEVSPNQDLTLNIKTSLNSTNVAPKMLLRVDYPPGFQFVSANPTPSFGNSVWNLGDLAPGSSHDVSITGKMVDVSDGEQKAFRIYTGSQSDNENSSIGVVFNSTTQTITIKKAFIEAKLFINGAYQREYAIDSKTPIEGAIHWSNNLNSKVNNLEISAKISGNALSRKSVAVDQGVYNSSTDTITWNSTSLSQFKEIGPGESGSVSFSFSTVPLFGGSGMLSQPSVNMEVSISGIQALEGDAVQNLNNSESKIVRIISDVGFLNKALYYSGPFKNTGPIPPKAENQTTYTIVWSLSNTSNNISKAQVISTLPPWVRFIGTVSPDSEDLTYNSNSKQIIWNIGNLPRGTGIAGPARQVSFQLAFTPSLSQLGTVPVIINDAVLTGHDDFANVDVRVNKTSLDTRLGEDSSFPPSGDRVVE